MGEITSDAYAMPIDLHSDVLAEVSRAVAPLEPEATGSLLMSVLAAKVMMLPADGRKQFVHLCEWMLTQQMIERERVERATGKVRT